MNNYLVVLAGPTGIGKTDLSIDIAKHFGTSIISSDSRQIYREMEIGTAVPNARQLSEVKHYFIRNKSIHDYYNVSRYELEVNDLLKVLFQKNKIVLLVGGSMMYIDAVCKGIDDLPEIDQDLRNELFKQIELEGLEGLRNELKKLDPEYYEIVDLRNKNRILRAVEVCLLSGKTYSSFRKQKPKERDFKIIKIFLDRNREELYDRINQRVTIMMRSGLLEEARGLYPYRHLNALKTVGYREIFNHFNGEYSIEKAEELIQNSTRAYARRQITWFRRDPEIKWFHPDEKNEIVNYVEGIVGK